LSKAIRIGLDGKCLTRNSTYGSKSGNSVHAKQLLRQLMALDNENFNTVYTVGSRSTLSDTKSFQFKELSAFSTRAYHRYAIEYPLQLLSIRSMY
jgi:hypothetical protein